MLPLELDEEPSCHCLCGDDGEQLPLAPLGGIRCLGDPGLQRRRPPYGALGIVLGDGLHGHARQAKEQGGNQSRAVYAARAVDQDGALRRVRDLSYSPSEVPLEAVEQEEVVPTPPGHRLVDVREQLVDLQDALGVEQRDSDEFDRRFVGRILMA